MKNSPHRPLIMVAPNGARRTKADHAQIPITLDEIVETATSCFSAGAGALHLHVRENDGTHSLDAGRYCEALTELSQTLPKLRVQITTEAAGLFSVSEQLTCLQNVRPDWASISVREIARDPDLASKVYTTCFETGCEVQHILYDLVDIEQLLDWQRRGIVHANQTNVLFVLGRYTTGQISDPTLLDNFLTNYNPTQRWMLCAFGPTEHSCLLKAADRGGDLRVGFENSLIDNAGLPHTDNAASVSTLISLLESTSK